MITCAREGCDEVYERKTHNQKFHNDECCRLATNARIMEKYYAKRDQRQGKTRFCTKCETTKLSRYNDSNVCSACKIQREAEANRSVTSMLLSVTSLAV